MKVNSVEIKLQKSMVDIVADIIRKKIINGEIKHNFKLSTRQLSEELRISRTPVREAIRRLESEGLIELLPRKGFMVKEYTIDEIKEIYEVRRVLEIKAINLACKNITNGEIVKIEEIIQKLKRMIQNEKENILCIKELNDEFHFAVYQASRNKILCQIIRNLWLRISGLLIMTFSIHYRGEETLQEHEIIVRALKGRNQEVCEVVLKRHMKSAERRLFECLNVRGGGNKITDKD